MQSLHYASSRIMITKYLFFAISVALFVVLLPLPESPVWLESKGSDASQAIKWLHLSARATATVKDDDDDNE